MFRNIERRYVRGNLTIIFATTILLLLSSSLLAGNIHIPTTSLKTANAQQTTTTTTTTAAAANTCTNLAISDVIASGSDSSVNLPKNTIDNNLNTRWSNLGIGSWIRLDLGIQKVICSVDIAWYNGNQRQNNFVISVSNDGTAFTNVFTGKSSGKTLSAEKYNLPANTSGRYVRITVNGNTQNNYASITEIDVYGPSIIKDKSYDINVLVIKYFPLTEQGTVDVNKTGETTLQGVSYENIRQKTIDITDNFVLSLEKASTYLGYKDSFAKPALRYHIFDSITTNFIVGNP